MAFATGTRTEIAYIAETTFNTTPSTPQMILLPKQSTSLDTTKDLFDDPTIVSDRMEYDERHGNIHTGGDLVFTLQHGQWDDLLEAALGGTWTSNVLKNGTTTRSFTFEEQFQDITQYRIFTGVRVNSFGLEVSPNAIVTGTFGLMGAGMTTSQTALDATPTALQVKAGMSHIGGTLTVGGSAAVCTAFSLSVDNGMEQIYGIGSSTARDVTWAESTVTGSATFYYEDLVMYNRFLNETTAAIVITLSDGTNTLTFTVPKAKFNTATLPIPGPGVLFVTMAFKGLKDATAGCSLSITRSA